MRKEFLITHIGKIIFANLSMRDYSIMPSNIFISTNKICHLLWVCYIVDMFQTLLFNTYNILRLLGTKSLFWDTTQVNDNSATNPIFL